MKIQELDHDKFEAIKVLAEIGVKISAGKAELDNLGRGKEDFLQGREADAIARVAAVLDGAKGLLVELDGYYSELVGFRNSLDIYVTEIRALVQSVERWKSEFDAEITLKNRELDNKITRNEEILKEIKGSRALLAGESEGIKAKREALRLDSLKIEDEWKTLGRVKKEIKEK